VEAFLPEEDVARFRFADALHIYPTNRLVRDFNFSHMVDLERPCLQIRADHSGPAGARDVPSGEAGNLYASFPLCLGARVMLMENMGPEWTREWSAWYGLRHCLGSGRGLADERAVAVFVNLDKYDGALRASTMPSCGLPSPYSGRRETSSQTYGTARGRGSP